MGLADFTKINTADFADKTFDCSCGEKHIVKTKKIIIGINALVMLKDVLMQILPAGRVLFLSCEDISDVYGKLIINMLNNIGYTVEKHIYPSDIKPDINCGGELLKHSEDIRLIIAYGSGSICDIAKHYSNLSGNKLVMIASSPSNDGYLSQISSLYIKGIKQNIITTPPYALICDLQLMAKAPKNMKAAGFGELCSKMISLVDWYYEKCIIGTHYCENIAKMIKQSINICIDEGEGLISGNEKSIYILSDALLRSSLCIQLYGGACTLGGEHLIADLLNPVKADSKCLLYGEKVFLISKYLTELYSLFFSNKFTDILPPVDKAKHADKLSKLTKSDYYTALSKMNYDLSTETYKIRSYKTEEFRLDLINMLQLLKAKNNTASVIFKRMYADAGYWISGVIKDKELTFAVALGADLSDKYTVLTHMRNAGIFEKYLI